MATRARATAARHALSAGSTWDRNVHSVRAGVQKDLAVSPKETCSATQASAMSLPVSTSAKGKPSAWRNGARISWKSEPPSWGIEKDMGAFLAIQGKHRQGRP